MKRIKLIVAALTVFACAGLAFAQENIIPHGDMEGGSVNECTEYLVYLHIHVISLFLSPIHGTTVVQVMHSHLIMQ